ATVLLLGEGRARGAPGDEYAVTAGEVPPYVDLDEAGVTCHRHGNLRLMGRELAHECSLGVQPARRVRDDAFDLLEPGLAGDERVDRLVVRDLRRQAVELLPR